LPHVGGPEDVNYYFRKAARVMDLFTRVERMLVTPFREVKVDVSVTLDNGAPRAGLRWTRPG
jgi:glutamate dehydrogenase (NAD(P)+)